jgi:hypothetical protein
MKAPLAIDGSTEAVLKPTRGEVRGPGQKPGPVHAVSA